MIADIQKVLENSHIKLPEERVSIKFRKIAEIKHLVQKEMEVMAEFVRSEAISTRRKEKVFKIPSNKEVIVTNKKSHPDFDEIDGIISYSGDSLRWLFYKEKEQIASSLKSFKSTLRDEISNSWQNQFFYNKEIRDHEGNILSGGLRTPQIGSLHAIASHWTLSSEIANIVMPTGTGKTETMLSVLVSERCKCLLVVVPSKALRDQTVDKFFNLGILRDIGVISHNVRYPIVGCLKKRPKAIDDLKIFDTCNVVVTVINTIAQGAAEQLLPEIAKKCSHLILDEAHHVPAKSWSGLRDAFKKKPILQFTATPFREDAKLIQGNIVYKYPLVKAQEDGLFQHINFHGVFHTELNEADEAIARTAISQLKKDSKKGYDHVIMARCKSKSRAKNIFKLYDKIAKKLNPVLILSNEPRNEDKIKLLRNGTCKIVVCVNMLAEGFDLPELKIAAMHDKFKSLAITLQFTGRFTRTSSKKLGNATIIANTGLEEVSHSIQSLYDEDPDWDKLVAKLSFNKVEEQEQLLRFLQKAEKLSNADDDNSVDLTPQSIIPKFNTVTYVCEDFHPHKFFGSLEKNHYFEVGWINKDPNVLFYVTRAAEDLDWCRSKSVRDNVWNIFIAYFDKSKKLLYIHSSYDSKSLHSNLVTELSGGTAKIVDGERVFRVFGRINRLLLQQVGLFQVGPRNLRYSMFAGRDLKQAITDVLAGRSQKSNISGTGFENGVPIAIGCSRKGKVWSRQQGPLLSWTHWCDYVGAKLIDGTINVDDLISNVLLPEEVETFPNIDIFYIDWADTFFRNSEDKLSLVSTGNEFLFQSAEIGLVEVDKSKKKLKFFVKCEDKMEVFIIELGNSYKYGYAIKHESGTIFKLKIWSKEYQLSEYLENYPPVIFYIDQSELQGNLFLKSKEPSREFPDKQILALDWPGVNIKHESQWKDGKLRSGSIQEWVMKKAKDEKFDVVFDDDGSNEIADVVCLREDDDGITVRMVHCKYSSKEEAGARVKDIVEVASQATKNIRWFWSFKRLLNRLMTREKNKVLGRPSRFFHGDNRTINYFRRLHSVKGKIKAEIIIAQPGIKKRKITKEITSILGTSDAYIKTILEVPLTLWCHK